MGKPTGFVEFAREDRPYVKAPERIKNFKEFVKPLPDDAVQTQAARCMECGIPFCHNGCPVNNLIPDWNDLVYRNRWREALDTLHSTNNFPEFTGRICPAPCEEACVLNINDQSVTIKTIECAIVDKGWQEGWIVPRPAARKTGKRVAVVGSGPAGMACAQQLARAGHAVTLYEKSDRIGGLLRYGIPDFKMEKHLIDRRMTQMAAEGVEFRPNTHIGGNLPAPRLVEEFDAVVLSGGAEAPRDLPVPGRELDGVHFAMDFLTQQNKRIAGDAEDTAHANTGAPISAKGKHVIVIGGGDTGSDCIGTSFRQGAKSVTQLEILARPPEHENKPLVWPDWPLKMRTSSSQEEGAERDWSVVTKSLSGKAGKVTALNAVRVDWRKGADSKVAMVELPNSAFELKADLVLLAMGFLHPVHHGMLEQLDVARDPRGNVQADTVRYQTSNEKVFAAGDMRRGQSLVVWAIREGRQCARAVDQFLMGKTDLPR
ncbi:MAG TPA: glutamate synthase subunit beta [Candidatus Sulfotelmatobacter sp.]|nr:glutamate synthase subunit beta [Candidatus Sulfotelmatobacter sp.]